MDTANGRLLELTILVAPARTSTFPSMFVPVQFSLSSISSSMTDGCSGCPPYNFFDSPAYATCVAQSLAQGQTKI